jgi:quercetin dioxygenase-like cupin family protein
MPDSRRLRAHPQERFSPISQAFDLNEAAAKLRAEPHGPVDGHRQVALYRHGPVTLLLFILEHDATLEYEAPGLVTIQVLKGELKVDVQGANHPLTAGQLLTIDPGSAHTVRASGSAELLVTVHKTAE